MHQVTASASDVMEQEKKFHSKQTIIQLKNPSWNSVNSSVIVAALKSTERREEMKTAKISLTNADGVVIGLWEVQDIKGFSDKQVEETVVIDEKYELLLYDSSRNDVIYLDDVQSELHWFFTKDDFDPDNEINLGEERK